MKKKCGEKYAPSKHSGNTFRKTSISILCTYVNGCDIDKQHIKISNGMRKNEGSNIMPNDNGEDTYRYIQMRKISPRNILPMTMT